MPTHERTLARVNGVRCCGLWQIRTAPPGAAPVGCERKSRLHTPLPKSPQKPRHQAMLTSRCRASQGGCSALPYYTTLLVANKNLPPSNHVSSDVHRKDSGIACALPWTGYSSPGHRSHSHFTLSLTFSCRLTPLRIIANHTGNQGSFSICFFCLSFNSVQNLCQPISKSSN